MPLMADVKNALGFLLRGEIKELLFRLRVHFSKLDLSYESVGALGLSPERSHDYRHSGGVQLEKVLDQMGITTADAIVDFGAGKGGALATFARYPFSRITGVELVPELADTARKNLEILKIDRVDIVICDAADFVDLEDYDYFYFYSPFPASVMEAVIGNIENSSRRRPRSIRIIYCNPEFDEVVTAHSVFKRTREFHHAQLQLPIYLYSNES